MSMSKPILAAAALLLLAAAPADAQGPTDPDPTFSQVTPAYPGQVSLFCLPNGLGDPLTQAFAFGGQQVNARVRFQAMNAMNMPISGLAVDRMWLENLAGSLYLCPPNPIRFASVPSMPTDPAGITEFTGPIFAGGYTGPGQPLQVFVEWTNGLVVPIPPSLNISLNSPDLNGDGAVNLSDVTIFSQDYFGSYNYRSDFFWDGALNLSDVSRMAQGLNSVCP
jgi:hypothetical protein